MNILFKSLVLLQPIRRMMRRYPATTVITHIVETRSAVVSRAMGRGMTDVSRCVPPRAVTMIRVWVRRKSPAPANPWSQGRRSREPGAVGAAGPPGAAESAGAEEVAGAAGGRGCCAMRQWHHEPPRSSMVLAPGPDVEPVGPGRNRHHPERRGSSATPFSVYCAPSPSATLLFLVQ